MSIGTQAAEKIRQECIYWSKGLIDPRDGQIGFRSDEAAEIIDSLCGWLRTVERKPTEEDGDNLGLVWVKTKHGKSGVQRFDYIAKYPDTWPLWMPILPVPEERKEGSE